VVRLFFSLIYTFEYQAAFDYNRPKKGTVSRMRDKKTHIYLDSQEKSILLHSLVELKNQLIRQGKYGDCVDELIFKVANAPIKKVKIEYV